ncbi:unnamed protein product, partial [Adineta steineri]
VFWLWCSSLFLIRDPRDVLTCGTYYSLIIGSSNVSTLLLTAASIDRFVIVVYPSHYSTFVTRTKALIKILCIIIFVSLLIIQYHFSFYFSYSYHVCEYYSYAQLWHGKIWPLIRVSLLAFIPCIVICVCSMVILRNRFYRRPSTTSETTGTRHMRTASLLLVIYSIYYTLSVIPMNILQFFHSYFLNDDINITETSKIDCVKFAQWKMLMKFCLLLMAINYSNKFIVHYLISMQFRRDVWNLLSKCTCTSERIVNILNKNFWKKNLSLLPIKRTIFPIPLLTSNDDPNFQQCPVESGAYPHTTNCSLFHMCTFGILTTYSCIDQFFFNPTTGKCQYLSTEKDMTCTQIIKKMTDTDLFSSAESVKGYDYYHRRKSEKSECTQNGIYPDVLDCALFHYCHQNKQHEIFKCPDGLHFDPKIFMCSAPQLVNCQYEPPLEVEITEDTIDSTSTLTSNTICNDYAPGTHLPIANRFDAFIICENDGKSTLIQCKPGLRYNALTTNCEIKQCEVNSALCKNNGHCIDEPTDIKGFQCICSDEYRGEYCDTPVEIIETITKTMDTTTLDQPQLTNPPPELVTSTIPAMTNDDFVPKSISFNDLHNNEKNNVIEDLSTINSPFTRIFHRLNNKVDHQQQLTEIIQIVFITVMTLIGLILLGSIIFGITVCIRMIISRNVDNVGTWKILTEESKV